MKKTISYILLALIVVLAIFVLTDYIGLPQKEVTIQIPVGSGANKIADILCENHIIHIKPLFLRYIRNDAMHLSAGLHTFKTHMGYKNALSELKRIVPLSEVVKVTIPEGYEAREIGSLLEKAELCTATAFARACQNAHTRYEFLPKNGNIEGYLFPATYDFPKGVDADALVDLMVDSFLKNMMTDENIARAESLSMSFHDVLTLASIIEREAALSEERATVSSVFHNRLKIGMRLESCATVQYILAERKPVLSTKDTKIDSPYNTYLVSGLPPAPIASPGTASLAAALFPAETDYLFFVADGSGGHTFSKTYDEHIAAQN